MKFKSFFLIFLSITLYAEILIPKNTTQLLVVKAKNFEINTAVLQAFEKKEKKWIKYKSTISVNLGRNGLGWGKGIINFNHKKDEPIKQEGDGKAPAGLFTLKSFFGYKDLKFNFQYLKVDKTTLCIDDSKSSFYNQIIQDNPKNFKSFEFMKRDDNLYKYGVIVAHNEENIQNSGSCIFLHVEKSKGSPTAGCTSMKEKELLSLMKWLDKSKNPMLLQVPEFYLSSEFK